MLALASTLLFLAEFSLAIRVYLHPSPQTKFATTTASPTQARLLVSHHLGLDSFDSWDDVDGSVWRIVNEAPIVGSAPPRALVLTVGEDVAAGMFVYVFYPCSSSAERARRRHYTVISKTIFFCLISSSTSCLNVFDTQLFFPSSRTRLLDDLLIHVQLTFTSTPSPYRYFLCKTFRRN